MPQPDSSELESPPTVPEDGAIDPNGNEGLIVPIDPVDPPVAPIDPSSNEDLIDPSAQDIPSEPLPEPPVRITIIPGRETDEDVEPGEEVPNIEVEVSTEPR